MENNDNDIRNRGKAGSPFVHIPGEVAFNPDLTKSDMFVFWIIYIFDTSKKHFFASNTYVAKKLNISEAQVSKSIARLKEEGYIKQIGFDGRRRTIAIDSNYVVKHRQHIIDFNNDESFSKIDNDDNDDDEEDKSDQAKKLTLLNTTENISSQSQKAYADQAKKLMQTKPKSLIDNNKNISKDYCSFSKEKETSISNEMLYNKDISLNKEENEYKEEENNLIQSEDEFILNKQIKEIVSYWNNKGKPLTKHQDKEDSSTYNEIKINLIETLNNGYSTIKIKQSIDHYHTLMASPFTSLNSSWMNYPKSLNLFLKFNSYTWSQISKKHPDFKIKSWFKECLKSEKDLLKKYTVLKQDKEPNFTNNLKEKFVNEFNYQKEFTIKDENNFIKATEKIFSFISENDDILPGKFIRQPVKLINYLFETVKDCNSKKQQVIYPWYLAQDWLYDQAFLTYLQKINVVWDK